MKLQPLTKDKTLGLKPFASASLRLTAICYVYISFQLFIDLASPGASERLTLFVFIRDTGLILLGLVLFFLPLFSLHRKLVQTKLEKMAWINDRYTKIIEKIEAKGDTPLDEIVQRELST